MITFFRGMFDSFVNCDYNFDSIFFLLCRYSCAIYMLGAVNKCAEQFHEEFSFLRCK